MVMELIVGVIALAFVALVVFTIIALQNLGKTMKKADRTLAEVHKVLDALSGPGVELTQNANKLVADVKKKAEALDFFFRPLYALKKEKPDPKNKYEKISEVMEFVAEGVRLFSLIKDDKK